MTLRRRGSPVLPDEEVHASWNEHERNVGASFCGRRLHETLRARESDDRPGTEPAVVREYAGTWRDTDEVACSTPASRTSAAEAAGVARGRSSALAGPW